MAFSPDLANRVRDALDRYPNITEKKMFGGLGYLLNGNMLVGIWKEYLILRLGPDQARIALKKRHVKAFDITGKPMKGWAMIQEEQIGDDLDLNRWVKKAMDFVMTLPPK